MKSHKHTTEEFVLLAKKVHGDKFDYSKTTYTDSKTKIIIICPVHGEFEQNPANHLHGRGCVKCRKYASSSKPKTTEQFVEDSSKVHNNYYDYSKTTYKNSSTKVTITCPIHGDFEQIAGNHARGSGCKKCGRNSMANKQKDTLASFVEKAKEVHGEYYSYNGPYTTARSPIEITCPRHGNFEQLPTNHLKGVGCPSCNGGMFNPSKPTTLYYLKVNDGQAFKIGITCKEIKERFTPKDNLKIEVIKTWKFNNGRSAYETEQFLLDKFKEHRYSGIPLLESGNTELLAIDIFEQLITELNP